jgi:hypothetical protein
VNTNASEEPAPFLFRVEVSKAKLSIGYIGKATWKRPSTRIKAMKGGSSVQVNSSRKKYLLGPLQRKVLNRDTKNECPFQGQ